MSTERIDIVVSENGSRTVKRNLEDVGKAGGTAARGVGLLQKALIGLSVGAALLYLQRTADTYTNILNKLRLVTSSTQNLTRVNNELFASANRTRSEYESTVDLYANLARSSKTLGLSQKDLLGITETVNQAIAISGTDAATAANGLRQLGQGLASGALRGDELNSVLENMPRLATAIADGMGITVGQLRKLGGEGKITAQAITDALKKSAPAIAAEFAKVTPTIAGSFTVLKNNMTKFIGDLDQATGISEAFARAILLVSQHLDTIAVLAGGVALAFAWSSAYSAIAGILGPMVALNKALGAGSTLSALYSIAMKVATGATRGFTAALLANPFTALLVVITAVVAAIVTWGDQVAVTADGAVSLKDAFFAALSFILDFFKFVAGAIMVAWDAAVAFISSIFAGFGTTVGEVFTTVMGYAKTVINGIIGGFVGAYRAVVATWRLFPAALGDLFVQAVNLAVDGINYLIRKAVEGINFLTSQANSILPAWAQIGQISAGQIDRVQNQWAGAAANVGNIWRSEVGGAMATDYLGNAWTAITDRARAMKAAGGGGAGTLDPAGPASPAAAADGKKDKGGKGQTRAEYLAEVNRETANSIELARSMNFEWAKVDEDMVKVSEHLAEHKWAQLTPTEEQGMRAQLKAMYDAQDMQERMRKAYDDFKKPQEDYEKGQAAINRVMAAFPQYAEQGRQALRDLQIEYLSTKSDLASGLELGRLTSQKETENVGGRAASAYGDEYKGANGALQDMQSRVSALKQLMLDDPINSGTYARRLQEIGVQALQLRVTLPGATAFDGLKAGLASYVADFKGVVPGLSQAWGSFFTEFANGAADSIGRAIVYGDDLGSSLMDVAKSALSSLISALIQLGIQWLVMQVIGQSAMAAIGATGAVAGVATAAAWAPAAAAVSLATFGANSGPAMAGIGLTYGLTKALSVAGMFADGGRISGRGGPRDDNLLALVSNGEAVMNAPAVSRYGPLIDAMNAGRLPAFADGGRVGGGPSAPMFFQPQQPAQGQGGGRGVKVTIEDHVGARFEVQRVSADEVRIIAREEMTKGVDKAVAGHLANPKSKISKSLKNNTTAKVRVE